MHAPPLQGLAAQEPGTEQSQVALLLSLVQLAAPLRWL